MQTDCYEQSYCSKRHDGKRQANISYNKTSLLQPPLRWCLFTVAVSVLLASNGPCRFRYACARLQTWGVQNMSASYIFRCNRICYDVCWTLS